MPGRPPAAEKAPTMNTTAGVMLLVVAVIGVLAVLGAWWALRGAPPARRRRRAATRRRHGRESRVAAQPQPASGTSAALTKDALAAAAASHEQTAEERIEAMRALLHRGDEKARRLAESSEAPAFADTQIVDVPLDDEGPLTRPVNWSEPTIATPTRPAAPEPGSGHIRI
jgi:hypothetical protein